MSAVSQLDALRGVCRCHVHVIGPHDRYPLMPVRSYTPMDATAADLAAMMRYAGVDRAVVVQPSVLGLDNPCTLDALQYFASQGLQGRARKPSWSTIQPVFTISWVDCARHGADQGGTWVVQIPSIIRISRTIALEPSFESASLYPGLS